ncbi:hypothetical protein [Bradyrhizobium sp. USDA 4461]
MVANRGAADIVAAGTDGNRDRSRPREIDRRNDIVGAGAIDDRGRTPVDHAVPDLSRLVIGHIARNDHFAAHRSPQNGDVGRLQGQFGVGSFGKPSCVHSNLLDLPARWTGVSVSRSVIAGKIEILSRQMN